MASGRGAEAAARQLLLPALVFAATRLTLLWLAIGADQYPQLAGSVADVGIYESWARTLLERDVAAYGGVGIEYPPASLPFFTLPLVADASIGYRAAFALLMAAVDIACFVGLAKLARREQGTTRGIWAWAVGVPLLGPLVYARFDLVPAGATLWAVVAASRERWFTTGAWLGLGAAAKVYPGLLVPVAAWIAARGRSWRQGSLAVVGGAALVGVAAVLPFFGHLGSLTNSVVGYHADRGIQLESVPANVLLLAARLGQPVFREFDYGAWHVTGAFAGTLNTASTVAAVVALVGVTVLMATRSRRGDWTDLADGLLLVLLWLMVTGKVLSPQFLLWPLALGAACLTSRKTRMTWPSVILLPAALLTQAIYPFLYTDLLDARTSALAVLTARNVLLVGCAVAGLVVVWKGPVADKVPRPSEQAGGVRNAAPRTYEPTHRPTTTNPKTVLGGPA